MRRGIVIAEVSNGMRSKAVDMDSMCEHPEIVVIGSLNADLVQSVDRLPRPGETLVGGDLEIFSGGKGANQAFAAGRMGARARMIGQVGSDGLASLLLASLESAGVNTAAVGKAGISTGAAVIFVLPDGENVIVISPGANATVTPALVAERLGRIDSGAYLLVQLEIPIESVAKSLTMAKARGATTILDPAPARALPSELLRNVDYITPNETEALALLGEDGSSMATDAAAGAAAQRILDLGPRNAILKLGARGCLISTPRGTSRVPGFQVTPVDTTAAGDVFNAALATALAEGMPTAGAARFANAAAALSVTKPGAQASVPRRQQVDQFLRRARAASP